MNKQAPLIKSNNDYTVNHALNLKYRVLGALDPFFHSQTHLWSLFALIWIFLNAWHINYNS